ncbi:MAG: hypothetical protein HRT90_06155, partial [Candidatus Margulisbacteria bacterium]|nr:hypothetical protein [Candidatus Margulisiibacteriota bacterium]
NANFSKTSSDKLLRIDARLRSIDLGSAISDLIINIGNGAIVKTYDNMWVETIGSGFSIYKSHEVVVFREWIAIDSLPNGSVNVSITSMSNAGAGAGRTGGHVRVFKNKSFT